MPTYIPVILNKFNRLRKFELEMEHKIPNQ